MKKRKLCQIMIAALMGSVFVNNAQATIIDHGNYLTDTATDLDWLDITETTSKSYNFVSNEFGFGGQFEGWRYATDSEAHTLFANVGITEQLLNADATNNANALSFLRNFYGYVNPPSDYYLYFQGLLDGSLSTSTVATRAVLEAYQTDIYGGAPSTNLKINYLTFDKTGSHWGVGSMLVRNAIPEPTVLSLLGLGMLGLGWSRTRRAG